MRMISGADGEAALRLRLLPHYCHIHDSIRTHTPSFCARLHSRTHSIILCTSKKLLTVFGATGAQGGNLISYVVKHSKLSAEFSLRGVTRDVTKPAAVALKDKGIEVVQADMNDPDSLKNAVERSWAVFGMTNYWDHASGEHEISQGTAIADAAVAAGSRLLIWSSLPNVTKMSNGKLSKVANFDSKALVEEYIRTLPIADRLYILTYAHCPSIKRKSPADHLSERIDPIATLELSTHSKLCEVSDQKLR